MCDICNINTYWEYFVDDYDLYKIVAEGSYTSMYILYNKERKQFILRATGDGHADLPIAYCPCCGRKL